MPSRSGANASPFDTPPSAATQGEEKDVGDFQGAHTGLLIQFPFQGVEGTPLSTGKATPPTPPCQGGKGGVLRRLNG